MQGKDKRCWTHKGSTGLGCRLPTDNEAVLYCHASAPGVAAGRVMASTFYEAASEVVVRRQLHHSTVCAEREAGLVRSHRLLCRVSALSEQWDSCGQSGAEPLSSSVEYTLSRRPETLLVGQEQNLCTIHARSASLLFSLRAQDPSEIAGS
jgi:hypothetical protein